MRNLLSLLFLSILIISGCRGSDEREIAALVNGKPIYEEDLVGTTLNDAIDQELLYEEALKSIDEKEIEKKLERKKEILIRSMAKEKLPPESYSVSDETIEEHLKKYKEEYKFKTIFVSELSFDDKRMAYDAYEEAKAGENFKEIQKKYSKNNEIPISKKADPEYAMGLFEGKEEGTVIGVVEDNGKFKILKLDRRVESPIWHLKRRIKMRLEREKIYQEALKMGIDKDVEPLVDRYKKGLLVDTYESKVARDYISRLKDQEIQDYYSKSDSSAVVVIVAELIFKDKDQAEKAYQMALSGEDLRKIKRDYTSRDGVLYRERLAKPHYANELFKGKETAAISEIIEEDGNYKIVQLRDKEEMAPDRVKPWIIWRLGHERRDDIINEHLTKLRENANIEIVGGEPGKPQKDE